MFNTISHTLQQIGVWYGGTIKTLIFHTKTNTGINLWDQINGTGLLNPSWFDHPSFQLHFYELTKRLPKSLPGAAEMFPIGLVPSFYSILWCAVLLASKHPPHQPMYIEKISIFSFRYTIFSIKEWSNRDCQPWGASVFLKIDNLRVLPSQSRYMFGHDGPHQKTFLITRYRTWDLII